MSEPIPIVSCAARFGDDVDPQEIANEEVKLFLEECEEEDADDSYEEQLESLVQSCIQDFPDEDDSPAARYAAQMARACITQGTRDGHMRVIKAFITYHRKRCPTWDPTAVTKQTPFDICLFITQKCGNKKDGFEGRKFATAVSTRAALTMWYRTLPSRRNESTVEWRYNEKTGVCSGLPTRSRAVAEYMVGLEKTKAKAGEATQSMRALSLDDIHRLHDHCFRDNQTDAERRWGVMRFAVYLFAFLMVLRMDEALKMMFEGVDNIPGDTEKVRITLGPRKTSQTGTGHSWLLSANDRDEKICPKRMCILLSELYFRNVPDFLPTGPLFTYIDPKRGSVDRARSVTTTVLHRALAADLQALGYGQWALYGTHSFRRGGCQYRVQRGWDIAAIAAWGGWTQVEAVTMYRYFYSPNDNHEFMDDYDRNLPLGYHV